MALVEGCRSAVGAAGVGLAVADAGGPVAVVAATPGVGQAGEDLQFALGEGPCQLASATGRMVHSPDLGADPRWSEYAREAGVHGIHAVFSAPLQVGAVQLGVLDVYRRVPGSLTVDALEALRVHAEAAIAMLLLLADTGRWTGSPEDLMELADIRPVVHQAAGMVAIQLDVSLDVALVRLRGAAFASERRLRAVAEDVVARRIRFDDTEAGVVRRESGDAARNDPDGKRNRVAGSDGPEGREPG